MMKAKKKNRFLTFCFSFLPGAGEMYMGFMRMGVSLMIAFFLMIFIPVVLMIDGLVSFAVVIWFYGFFHVNHLASLSDEEFAQIEDTYLFEMDALTGGKDFVQKYHKWIAGGLIIAGICLLWNTATDLMFVRFPAIYEMMSIVGNYVPRVLIAVVIIVIGINMIRGKKKQLAQDETMFVKSSEGAENVIKEE